MIPSSPGCGFHNEWPISAFSPCIHMVEIAIGIRLLNRLAMTCGLAFQRNGGTDFAFPCPEDMISLSPGIYRSIGWNRQKVRAITELADDIIDEKGYADTTDELLELRRRTFFHPRQREGGSGRRSFLSLRRGTVRGTASGARPAVLRAVEEDGCDSVRYPESLSPVG